MPTSKDCFQFGPLDQVWQPDGLYTTPTDAALKYDLVRTKELGFNLIWSNSPKLCFGIGKFENLGFHKAKNKPLTD